MKTPKTERNRTAPSRSVQRLVVRVGDYVKLSDTKGMWRVAGKRRGWLRLILEGRTHDEHISALESTVTWVAHNVALSEPGANNPKH